MSLLLGVALAILVQAYVGYPVSLLALGVLAPRRSRHRVEAGTPHVSLVISAHNEAAVIRAKIENSLALDYPEAQIERVVVSDGSSDATNAIAATFASRGVRLRTFDRRGKVACLNAVIPTLSGDIVVMSDANSMYDPGSVRALVRHFADPRVGCVSGRLRYVNPQAHQAGDGERLYWSYEGFVKRLESRLGALLGANGAIYAFRRHLFRSVDPLTFCDDVIPIRILIDGHLAIEDPEAGCTEVATDEGVEMRRRRRHASFGLRSMAVLMREALARGRVLVVYQCLSHRVLRWMGWLALVGLAAGSFGLPPGWRAAAVLAQAAVYGAALAGLGLSRLAGRAPSPLYLPYYFLVITSAGFLGWVALLRGTDKPWWEPRQ